jgi:5-histidylcysteine sulfoxide synthase/putative 4-mercaptohistidine N1-methyltranferase
MTQKFGPPTDPLSGTIVQDMVGTYTAEELRQCRTIPLNGESIEKKRAEVLDYFHKTFTLYETLFECLANDDVFLIRPNPLRHPLIFYFGHTAVFFINKLRVAGLIEERIDSVLESSLAIGVDEMSWDDMSEENYVWPTAETVRDYRNKTRNIVDQFIRNAPLTLPIKWDDPLWVVLMGIEHERIHVETSSVLIRELPLSKVKDHADWGKICPNSIGDVSKVSLNGMLSVNGGTVVIGKEQDAPLYGWDNEYGNLQVTVKPFMASKYLVSNAEYLEFMQDGGYQKEAYWTEDGWSFITSRKITHPIYWVKDGGENYKYRSLLKEIPMPWDWPVDINWYESKAFCNWKSAKTKTTIRMPSEAEWKCLRNLDPRDQHQWGEGKAPGNVNMEHYMSSCPVNAMPFGETGFYDIFGNVWQWTETFIDGLAGFKVHPVYDDFSVPTFDGRHMLFKGGSWASTGNSAIANARYAFRPHFYQHAGLRYVQGEELKPQKTNTYETDSMLAMYIEMHFGEEYFGVPNFPKACADHCLRFMEGKEKLRALDVGCATGRCALELATQFEHVDAFDFSARLIQAPVDLQTNGSLRFALQDEGELCTLKDISLAQFGLEEAAKRVVFMQSDACNMNAKFSGYNLIFAGNLIDRLYDPSLFLDIIHQRIEKGGLLVLTSPYTWLEEFTERSKWVGGFKDPGTGESFTTLDGLKVVLSPHFRFVENLDVPFVIRETRRKYQRSIADMSVWERL